MVHIPHWGENPEAWGTLKLNDERVPGWWSVELDNKWTLNVKKAKGSDGANIADLGRIPSEITFTGRIVSQEDWDAIQDLLPQLTADRPAKRSLKAKSNNERVPKGTRTTFKVSHPAAAVLSIREVYFTLITAPTLDDTGIMTLVWRALEVKAPRPTKSKVNTKGPSQLESDEATIIIQEAERQGRTLESSERYKERGQPVLWRSPTTDDKQPQSAPYTPVNQRPGYLF